MPDVRLRYSRTTELRLLVDAFDCRPVRAIPGVEKPRAIKALRADSSASSLEKELENSIG
jgi:hypothetical protein